MQIVLVPSFTEKKARKPNWSPRGPSVELLLFLDHTDMVFVESVWPRNRGHPCPQFRHQHQLVQALGSLSQALGCLRYTAARLVLQEFSGCRERRGHGSLPVWCLHVVVSHHSMPELPRLLFLYLALASCTWPFSLRHLHWAQVTLSRRLQIQPLWPDILPHMLSLLALRRKSSPSLIQSKACLCLSSIILHPIFRGQSWPCEMKCDLVKWNKSKSNHAK